MATFSKNQAVNFTRNSVISSTNTPIVTVLPTQVGQPQIYIIENSYGWTPDSLRATRYELDPTKKYLFVAENELTIV